MSPEEVEKRLIALIVEYRAFIEKRLVQGSPYAWGNLMAPMEEFDAKIHAVWSPFSHRQSVVNDASARATQARCEKLLSDFSTEIGQSAELYSAFQELLEKQRRFLSPAQNRALTNVLRDSRLAGVNLPEAQKERFKAIVKELTELQTKFSDNLMDAGKLWKKHFTDEKELSGLPEATIAGMKQAAEDEGLSGWLLPLRMDTYVVVMTHSNNRELRREFLEAWRGRASDVGPCVENGDNAPVFEKILSLRHEQAQLLGFASYAEFSLATKMAESPAEVMGFLDDFVTKAQPFALEEYTLLSEVAKERDGVTTLEWWDVSYYVERLKQERFSVDSKEVKKYFPVSKVLKGMFTITEKLYGIHFRERTDLKLWHEDVRFFELFSPSGALIGGIYMDLYARENKRGGAWMDDAVGRRRDISGNLVLPVGYLNTNSEPPVGDNPALLTHDEVTTVFHEFGHNLHHLLTEVEVPAVSGINGVEWDAVELPSQFMENFAWTKEGIALISEHCETGTKLPDELFEKMLAARNFGEGLATIRQLILSLFDFRLYAEYDPEQAAKVLDLYREVSMIHPAPSFEKDRFPCTFAHIFAGVYAAGYYGYKWAEVLSADSFSPFRREDGSIDWSMGRTFLDTILSRGGVYPMMENFVDFRGREPAVDALLRQYGFMQ